MSTGMSTGMSERLSLFLLRRAARRWPRGDEMLAEWRAELCTMDSTRGRLWFALSLAVSRPHRVRTVSLRRALPGVISSFLLLLALPVALGVIANRWWTVFSSDTVVWQSLTVAGCAAGAVALGVLCARFTAGVTRVIKPMLLSSWVFGVPYLLYLTIGVSAIGLFPRSFVIDLSAWLAGAIVCGIVAVRLTLRGRTKIAWAFVALATPVGTVLSRGHGIEYVFDGWSVGWVALTFATQPFLYVTLFGLVYTRSLAVQHALVNR